MLRHILASDQFSRKDIERFCRRAAQYKALLKNKTSRLKLQKTFPGRLMQSLFFEPSTRTDLSFRAAAHHLGMTVHQVANAKEFSSAVKGERPEHTGRVISGYYSDVIVVRHHEEGGPAKIAERSLAPVINAGDGGGEHPTQMLLDMFTIQERFKKIDGIRVVLAGDLKYGRTTRSLAIALSKFNNVELIFVAPKVLEMKKDIIERLKETSVRITKFEKMEEVFQCPFDVWYHTRVQKERLKNEKLTKEDQKTFTITTEHLKRFPKKAILMHPLPIAGEITEEVDHDPRAIYFTQSDNGLPMRMAILEWVLRGVQ
ncbi:MAG: aspartate carbamoyltransferase [Nanoarchaeota archaeon]|nr:aspartate carbamoyltransferase [Nanoarchaeota archaeon]